MDTTNKQGYGNTAILNNRFIRFSVTTLLLFSGILVPKDNGWVLEVDQPKVRTIMDGLKSRNLGIGQSGPQAVSGQEVSGNIQDYHTGIMEAINGLWNVPKGTVYTNPDQAVDQVFSVLVGTNYGKQYAAA